MKYKIEEAKAQRNFKPFSVTLTFETRDEYVNFHDNVMNKITKTPKHVFHKHIYNAVSIGKFNSEGTI